MATPGQASLPHTERGGKNGESKEEEEENDLKVFVVVAILYLLIRVILDTEIRNFVNSVAGSEQVCVGTSAEEKRSSRKRRWFWILEKIRGTMK